MGFHFTCRISHIRLLLIMRDSYFSKVCFMNVNYWVLGMAGFLFSFYSELLQGLLVVFSSIFIEFLQCAGH